MIDVHKTLQKVEINGRTTVNFIINMTESLNTLNVNKKTGTVSERLKTYFNTSVTDCKLTLPINLVTSEMSTAAYQLPEATTVAEMSVDAVISDEDTYDITDEKIVSNLKDYEPHLVQLGFKWSEKLQRYIENSVNESLCCKYQCCGYCDAYYVENAYGKNAAWSWHYDYDISDYDICDFDRAWQNREPYFWSSSTPYTYTNAPSECKETFGFQDSILDRTAACIRKAVINSYFSSHVQSQDVTSNNITTIDVC